jgi:LmbE family N-acetylglucosaminyl deacetylase
MSPLTVLHLAPHPDDEAIGAPATLRGLGDGGHRVVNLACGLGRPAQATRRRKEVELACRRARWELRFHDPPLSLHRDDEGPQDELRARAQEQLAATTRQLAEDEQVDIVVAPSPHDGHPEHEVVGRAARDAVLGLERPPCLWLWGLWADLPFPTLYSGFGRRRLWRALRVLSAHEGELARNDYRTLVRGRAAANRVLGSERIFGFATETRAHRYAELLTEIVVRDGTFWTGVPRELDPQSPLPSADSGTRIAWWLDERSPADRRAGQA